MYKKMIVAVGIMIIYTSCASGMSGRLINTLKTSTLSKQQVMILNRRYLSQKSSILDYVPVRLTAAFIGVSALTLGASSAITYGLDIILDAKNREKPCTGKPGCPHKCTQGATTNEAQATKSHAH